VQAENILLKREGEASGRVVAKVADLGLHVKVGGDRSVMLRRRGAGTGPMSMDGKSGMR
jgi:hypothetical protein